MRVDEVGWGAQEDSEQNLFQGLNGRLVGVGDFLEVQFMLYVINLINCIVICQLDVVDGSHAGSRQKSVRWRNIWCACEPQCGDW